MSVVIDNNYQLKEIFNYIYHNNFTVETEVEGTQHFKKRVTIEKKFSMYSLNMIFNILSREK